MRWRTWCQVAALLAFFKLAKSVTPTVCEDDSCRCDSFTRVICNCSKNYEEVTLRPDGAYRIPTTATAIIIEGCARVYFLEDSIRNLIQLRSVEIRNVLHVYIKERALLWSPFNRDSEVNPGIRIAIQNSTIHDIPSHAIQGRVNEVILTGNHIDAIRPFAFSSLTGVKSIELTDNIFYNIEIQAFKKFTTLNFLLRGGSIRSLPSRFLSDVEVTNLFRIDGVSVKLVYSLTFLVSGPRKVVIENNMIGTLEGDTFHITTRGPITFRNNTVIAVRKGAFYGFSVEPEVRSTVGLQELLIDNNTFTELTPSALQYDRTSLALYLDGLRLNTSCECGLANTWQDLLHEQGGTISCWYALEGHYVSLPTYVDSRCGAFKQNFWIIVTIVITVLLVVAAIIIFLIVRHEIKKKRKLPIVLPDGKTYRETEFHIVVERAELLTTDV